MVSYLQLSPRSASENTLADIDCAEPEVEAKLKELKPDKAARSNGFLPKVLKVVVDGVVPQLCPNFNRSLTTAEVPLDFWSADVCPIPKKGLFTDTGDYRPISLSLSPTSRTGRSISSRLTTSSTRENTVFIRKGLVSQTSLTCSTTFSEFDRSTAVDVIFLDLGKAFNKFPHKRLMRKVRALGIQGTVADWQRVIVNGVPSDWTAVRSGALQGSVLESLLFVIYIDDLDLGLSSKVSKFADDTKLGINGANLVSMRALQRDLAVIGEWSTVWQMSFNLDKEIQILPTCICLHVGTANQEKKIYSLLWFGDIQG